MLRGLVTVVICSPGVPFLVYRHSDSSGPRMWVETTFKDFGKAFSKERS